MEKGPGKKENYHCAFLKEMQSKFTFIYTSPFIKFIFVINEQKRTKEILLCQHIIPPPPKKKEEKKPERPLAPRPSSFPRLVNYYDCMRLDSWMPICDIRPTIFLSIPLKITLQKTTQLSQIKITTLYNIIIFQIFILFKIFIYFKLQLISYKRYFE